MVELMLQRGLSFKGRGHEKLVKHNTLQLEAVDCSQCPKKLPEGCAAVVFRGQRPCQV